MRGKGQLARAVEWEQYYAVTYLLTYLLHGAASFLKSKLVCS